MSIFDTLEAFRSASNRERERLDRRLRYGVRKGKIPLRPGTNTRPAFTGGQSPVGASIEARNAPEAPYMSPPQTIAGSLAPPSVLAGMPELTAGPRRRSTAPGQPVVAGQPRRTRAALTNQPPDEGDAGAAMVRNQTARTRKAQQAARDAFTAAGAFNPLFDAQSPQNAANIMGPQVAGVNEQLLAGMAQPFNRDVGGIIRSRRPGGGFQYNAGTQMNVLPEYVSPIQTAGDVVRPLEGPINVGGTTPLPQAFLAAREARQNRVAGRRDAALQNRANMIAAQREAIANQPINPMANPIVAEAVNRNPSLIVPLMQGMMASREGGLDRAFRARESALDRSQRGDYYRQLREQTEADRKARRRIARGEQRGARERNEILREQSLLQGMLGMFGIQAQDRRAREALEAREAEFEAANQAADRRAINELIPGIMGGLELDPFGTMSNLGRLAPILPQGMQDWAQQMMADNAPVGSAPANDPVAAQRQVNRLLGTNNPEAPPTPLQSLFDIFQFEGQPYPEEIGDALLERMNLGQQLPANQLDLLRDYIQQQDVLDPTFYEPFDPTAAGFSEGQALIEALMNQQPMMEALERERTRRRGRRAETRSALEEALIWGGM